MLSGAHIIKLIGVDKGWLHTVNYRTLVLAGRPNQGCRRTVTEFGAPVCNTDTQKGYIEQNSHTELSDKIFITVNVVFVPLKQN